MATVGAYEAKTHLPTLLKRVAHGEEILITRRGRLSRCSCRPRPTTDGMCGGCFNKCASYARALLLAQI